jgi:hypothetical protein
VRRTISGLQGKGSRETRQAARFFGYAQVHKRATIVRFVFMFQPMKLRNHHCIVESSVAVLGCSSIDHTCTALANSVPLPHFMLFT